MAQSLRRPRTYAPLVALCLLLVLPIPRLWAQAPLAQWTILVYLDGDNNLEREAIDDFLEMASVGSNSQVQIVAQFDRTPGYDRRYGDWQGTKRFHVTPGLAPEAANALMDLGEVNMGDVQTLIDFVLWGKLAFPAQRTRDILFLLSILVVILLFFLFRFARPERLVDPDAFSSVVIYFRALGTPASPFLPSSWAA